MKSSKKTKKEAPPRSRKMESDSLHKPSKMPPVNKKEKNNWKHEMMDDMDEFDEQPLDENFSGFDEPAEHDDEDDY